MRKVLLADRSWPLWRCRHAARADEALDKLAKDPEAMGHAAGR